MYGYIMKCLCINSQHGFQTQLKVDARESHRCEVKPNGEDVGLMRFAHL